MGIYKTCVFMKHKICDAFPSFLAMPRMSKAVRLQKGIQMRERKVSIDI